MRLASKSVMTNLAASIASRPGSTENGTTRFAQANYCSIYYFADPLRKSEFDAPTVVITEKGIAALDPIQSTRSSGVPKQVEILSGSKLFFSRELAEEIAAVNARILELCGKPLRDEAQSLLISGYGESLSTHSDTFNWRECDNWAIQWHV